MDVTAKTETSETLNAFSFPERDYKNGKLKRVRGRMLKKLMKYEFKAIFPALLIVCILLFALTVLLCLFFRADIAEFLADTEFGEYASALLMPILLLYLYTLFGTILVPFITSANRYQKNFFKDEGYLTFSIPATMEEHIAAKHLSGAIASLIAAAADFISVLIVVAISFGTIALPEIHVGVSEVFRFLEELLLGAEGLAAAYTVAGALCCWGQKFSKKRQIFLRLLCAYLLFIVISSAISPLTQYAREFFLTTAGGHVGRCLGILLLAGGLVFSVWYELRTLKQKLNLK